MVFGFAFQLLGGLVRGRSCTWGCGVCFVQHRAPSWSIELADCGLAKVVILLNLARAHNINRPSPYCRQLAMSPITTAIKDTHETTRHSDRNFRCSDY
jgi:hypothetical protein